MVVANPRPSGETDRAANGRDEMKRTGRFLLCLAAGLALVATGAGPARAEDLARDVVKTSGGDLAITCIGHGSLMLTYGGKVIQVDPWLKMNSYDGLPKADLILITHEHRDHLDAAAVAKVSKNGTVIIANQAAAQKLGKGRVMKNGDSAKVLGLAIEAVPAYNLKHMRSPGNPYHPKGVGNGYVIAFGDKRVYIAGDTENTPEMKALKNIDVAFLPMNLPYTMTPEMVADAAKAFKPKVLYPYHFGQSDTNRLKELLKAEPGIEVRIRPFGQVKPKG